MGRITNRGARDAAAAAVPIEGLEPRRMLSVALPLDVNARPASTTVPTSLVDVNGTLYFVHADGVHGRELWRSDGTAAGTRLVKDVTPGPGGSSPTNLANVNGTLYFAAPGPGAVNDTVLWRSDGTEAGTRPVGDVGLWGGVRAPYGMTAVGDAVFFFARDGGGSGDYRVWRAAPDGSGAPQKLGSLYDTYGTFARDPVAFGGAFYFVDVSSTRNATLWRSDGTPGGTGVFAGFPSDTVEHVMTFGGRLLFTAGGAVWASDGTAAGTRQLAVVGSGLADFTVAGDKLFFTATTTASGKELWATDGTAVWQVRDIVAGSGGSSPSSLVAFNGRVYFAANDGVNGGELWSSDGTAAGTDIVRDVRAGAGSSSPANLFASGGAVYFSAYGGSAATAGVWRSDGTAAGTVLLRSITGYTTAVPGAFAASGGTVFFPAYDVTTGGELWASGGTADTTRLVADVFPETAPSNPLLAGTLDGRLYYFADDGAHGTEPWSTDGTAAGTSLLKDLNPSPVGTLGSFRAQAQVAGPYLYFAYQGGMWRTDGTAAGTIRLADAPKQITSWGVLGDKVYYTMLFNTGLWVSDGTPVGTKQVTSADVGTIGAAMDGLLYTGGYSAASGRELWRSDGTAAGTYAVADVNPGPADGNVQGVTVVGDRLFFFASDGTDTHLYTYTPTSGATLVSPTALVGGSAGFAASGGKYYAGVRGGSGEDGTELWVSDGTAEGTREVADLLPGAGSSLPGQFFDLDGVLLFTATGPSGQRSLYRTDGTAAGTYALGDFEPTGTGYPWVSGFVRVGGAVYLTGTRGSSSTPGLYRTDGTADGTRLVSTIDSYLREAPQLAALNGSVYFVGSDSVRGREVWRYTPDQPPLAVTRATFAPAGPAGARLTFGLNRPAVDGPWTGKVTVVNRTTGVAVPAVNVRWVQDASGALVVTFPGYSGGVLPDGDYRVVVPAGATGDAAGDPLAQDFTFDFFVLAGDANRDRVVNFADLLALAKNYNKAGATWADGDFTGDGTVNFADLLLLAKAYDKALPALVPVTTVAPAAAPVTANPVLATDDGGKAKPVFSTARVTKPAPPKPAAAKAKAVAKPKGR